MAAPIIVTALFGKADSAMLEALRRAHYPAARDRAPAHLTLFRHLPPSLAGELARRLARLAAAPAPDAILAGLMDLGGGTAIRVRAPALEAMRAALTEDFQGALTPGDGAPWRPHVTIQNKVTPAEARALQRQLAGRFDGRPLAIAGLGAWEYRDGPWAPLGSWRFRG